MNLPIVGAEDLIISTVKNNRVTIVVGETGSGKTTKLPVFFWEAGLIKDGMLGVTQPRRIAAISVAEHVSKSVGVAGLVGYQVRFDNHTVSGAKIKFMTDGILLRELQLDPYLSKYSLLIIDEAHIRNQNTDFVLGLLKDLLLKRDDLKVVVTSATIDHAKFSRYFWDAPVINVSGRTYPVEIEWSEYNYDEEHMISAICDKIAEIHRSGEDGDILVFVAGVADINQIIMKVAGAVSDAVLLPAHGSLDPESQKKIFKTFPGKRRIVIATEIAETSLTLDGIKFVIDSGLVKQTNFHPETGIQSLDLMEHSKAGCNQRAGRAGRTQPGVCYRFYTEKSFADRPEHTIPEILRTSLENVVLMMEDIGIIDVMKFDFVDRPDREAFSEAYETLIALGAIKKGQKGLTRLGEAMAQLPLEAKVARMVIEANKHNCVKEVVTVAAFLSARNIYSRPKEKELFADRAHAAFKDKESDALTFLKIWDEFEKSHFSAQWCFSNYLNQKALQEVAKIRKQILDILAHRGMSVSSTGVKPNPSDVMKAVAMGLVYNLFVSSPYERFAYTGVLRRAGDVFIHPGSSTFGFGYTRAQCFVAAKIMKTAKNYAHYVTQVRAEWLPDMVPHLCTYGGITIQAYDEVNRLVVGERDVILCERLMGRHTVTISVGEAAAIQAKRVRAAEEGGLVPLVFKEVHRGGQNIFSAVFKGKPVVVASWGSAVEDGATYYCQVDVDHSGDYYAVAQFKIHNFLTSEGEAADRCGMGGQLQELARRFVQAKL